MFTIVLRYIDLTPQEIRSNSLPPPATKKKNFVSSQKKVQRQVGARLITLKIQLSSQ